MRQGKWGKGGKGNAGWLSHALLLPPSSSPLPLCSRYPPIPLFHIPRRHPIYEASLVRRKGQNKGKGLWANAYSRRCRPRMEWNGKEGMATHRTTIDRPPPVSLRSDPRPTPNCHSFDLLLLLFLLLSNCRAVTGANGRSRGGGGGSGQDVANDSATAEAFSPFSAPCASTKMQRF